MENNLKFAESHEWILDNGDGTVTMGISEHAQELLGDIVYVELPETETEVEAGDEFSTIESTKAASDIYAPVSGEIIEVNEDLEDSPETINDDSYNAGWICKIKMSNPSELDNLKTAEDYLASIED
ncbi:glycine cleavage system protein GcvH [Vibrio sp.]|nr:glycine cleavage system protein GcvH [Vibrio sp.]